MPMHRNTRAWYAASIIGIISSFLLASAAGLVICLVSYQDRQLEPPLWTLVCAFLSLGLVLFLLFLVSCGHALALRANEDPIVQDVECNKEVNLVNSSPRMKAPMIKQMFIQTFSVTWRALKFYMNCYYASISSTKTKKSKSEKINKPVENKPPESENDNLEIEDLEDEDNLVPVEDADRVGTIEENPPENDHLDVRDEENVEEDNMNEAVGESQTGEIEELDENATSEDDMKGEPLGDKGNADNGEKEDRKHDSESSEEDESSDNENEDPKKKNRTTFKYGQRILSAPDIISKSNVLTLELLIRVKSA